jgi:hypothetical protein
MSRLPDGRPQVQKVVSKCGVLRNSEIRDHTPERTKNGVRAKFRLGLIRFGNLKVLNFDLTSFFSSTSIPRHLHPIDQHRPRAFAAEGISISAHGFNALEHVFQVTCDRDFLNGVGDAAFLDPEAGGAA